MASTSAGAGVESSSAGAGIESSSAAGAGVESSSAWAGVEFSSAGAGAESSSAGAARAGVESSSAGAGAESSSAGAARAGVESSSAGAGDESSSAGAAREARAMEVAPFVDGQYVQFFNRARMGYLFADVTGRGVSLDHRYQMINTAWVVQIVETDTAVRVMFRGAYGRYLATTRDQAPPRHIGFIAAQCTHDDPDDNHIRWWTTPGKKGSVVLLNGPGDNLMALRANGRYRWWNTRVTVENIDNTRVSSMLEWFIDVVPMMAEKPPFQVREETVGWVYSPERPERLELRYIVADDNGDIHGQGWTDFVFYGRSVLQLRFQIAHRMRVNVQGITLFILAGNLAQPTLLITDLPYRDDPIDIIVFRVGTTAHNGLLYPDLALD